VNFCQLGLFNNTYRSTVGGYCIAIACSKIFKRSLQVVGMGFWAFPRSTKTNEFDADIMARNVTKQSLLIALTAKSRSLYYMNRRVRKQKTKDSVYLAHVP